MTPAPLLVIGIGNPSRGDDALGPAFLARLEQAFFSQVQAHQLELLTDFQLQVEHALDLQGRQQVVFVDASVDGSRPFQWRRLRPQKDRSHSSHALTPSAVLEAHERVFGPSPEAWELAIRGESFDLGEDLSPQASSALEQAVAFFVGRFATGSSLETSPTLNEQMGVRWQLRGAVQGVGFRPWVLRHARALGLRGSVRNTYAGLVIEAWGPPERLETLEELLQRSSPPAAVIDSLHKETWPVGVEAPADFTIADSLPQESAELSLPPDLATCETCQAETTTPGDRRHAYAFTSCTECGPRFAITQTLPFDRERTSMRAFPVCEDCQREYESEQHRRFHAQTIACPQCGPQLSLCDAQGRPWPGLSEGSASPQGVAILEQATTLLRSGGILAIRGLGAFHFTCDALQEDVVQRLRKRKRRDHQPFAVMVEDLDAAERLARLTQEARDLLGSPARPIVLSPAIPGGVAPSVLAGSQRIGLLLPYTPLQRLLLARVGGPLVMTSGNFSGEPVCKDNDEALRQLGQVADAFVLHDLAIARRVEDSVIDVSAPGARPWRRSRGFVPRPIQLPRPAPEPILAVGGHLKNTICIVVEDRAYLSAHLGDLDSVEAEQAWQQEVQSFEDLLGVRPRIVAHDLHPDYATTRYAAARGADARVGVQHHLAHVLATAAELHLEGAILGLAFDGTGYGLDGTAWGGEFLQVEGTRWQRFASFRPIALPGGEQALRQIWRQAYALLVDAFGDEARDVARYFRCFETIPSETLGTLEQMLRAGLRTPKARGVGRAFDAVAALCLGLSRASFEGQAALALEELCGDLGAPAAAPYPWSAPSRFCWTNEPHVPLPEGAEIDLRPMTRALVADLQSGVSPSQVARRFHATISQASCDVVQRASSEQSFEHIVLSGGALQNRQLETQLLSGLSDDRLRLARQIPVNDGGLALGQAWSAVLNLRAQTEGRPGLPLTLTPGTREPHSSPPHHSKAGAVSCV